MEMALCCMGTLAPFCCRMAEMKREATAAVNLMRETFSRIRSDEESRKGLVVVRALYGSLVTLSVPAEREKTDIDEIIDVTIPLQCLVKDSKLVLHDASKVCDIQILFLIQRFLHQKPYTC